MSFFRRKSRAPTEDSGPKESELDENKGKLYRSVRIFAVEAHNLTRLDTGQAEATPLYARSVARVTYKDQSHTSGSSGRTPSPVYENFDCVLRDVNPDDQDSFLVEIHERHTLKASVRIGSARIGIGGKPPSTQ